MRVFWTVMLVAGLALSACGKKGPLQDPPDKVVSKPILKTPTTSTDRTKQIY